MYNLPLCPVEKPSMIGFVHIPKTAGTTVKFILRNSILLKHCDIKTINPDGILSDDDVKFAHRVFFFGLDSIAGHSLIYPTGHLSEPIQYFTFVRDPIQRCASNYQHVKRARQRGGRDVTLEEFLEDGGIHNLQVKTIAGEPDLEKAKEELQTSYFFVGLVERFAESILLFQALCPYKIDVRYERRHVAKDNTAKKEALENPDSRRLMEECNTLDMELYQFVRDVMYPAQLKKAGMEHIEVNEAELEKKFYPLRYKFTRGYNQGIYRNLMKLRKRLAR
jgi:hypothetical protein